MEENKENEEEENVEIILSVCNDNGKTAAVAYNLMSLELFIYHEIFDLKPDYVLLKQVFEQVKPSFLVVTGSNVFFEELMTLLDPSSEKIDLQKFKITKKNAANADNVNVSFYQINRSTLDEHRTRIFELNLPGLYPKTPSDERQNFISSVMPMSQELVILCLGNLLKYLNDNRVKWQHAFLTFDKNPIITDVVVSILESQVLIDENSFNSLNIFSNLYHPSSFKMQIRKDGLSLFNLLNNCSSSMAVQELKRILRHPTRDIHELNLRLSTVEWCMQSDNVDHIDRFKKYLTGLVNVHSAFRRIHCSNGNNFTDWKSLKQTVKNINDLCRLCTTFSPEHIQSTILDGLGSFYTESTSINDILFTLEKIVDIEEIKEQKRFVVKKEIDPRLDEKKKEVSSLLEDFNGLRVDEDMLKTTKILSQDFQFIHFPEIGFVVGTTIKIEELNLETIERDGIELFLNTSEARYFKTPNCKLLNDEYERRMTEVIKIELEILEKLLKYINERFAELGEAAKTCSKLDCLISFSIVAKKRNYVKPKITADQVISIVNGRHPLVELMKDYVSSTTDINEKSKNFINIIRAPNSSGKSCYIKQVAMICFMAHIGCFVPAESCTISLLNSIYTRIYTPESIFHNESAFMSDLQQMSKIVMNSSNKSLILIDEFAKGTFYKDGIAILSAVIEHFAERNQPPFVFVTTHYHQITSVMRANIDYITFKTIITEKNDSNVFHSTFKLKDGFNEQQCITEFPESKSIMKNIFLNKERDEELRIFNEATMTSIKAFILILAKMMVRKNHVTYDFISDIYSKIDIENFLNL